MAKIICWNAEEHAMKTLSNWAFKCWREMCIFGTRDIGEFGRPFGLSDKETEEILQELVEKGYLLQDETGWLHFYTCGNRICNKPKDCTKELSYYF